jgi:hypothetical protein
MVTSIAEYYMEELEDWKNIIALHLHEIDELEEWLNIILQYDTVPMFEAKGEHYLNQFHLFKQNWLKLRKTIETLEARLLTDERPIENKLVSDELKAEQKELRNKMRNIEKDYIDTKYDCDDFVAETVTTRSAKL